MKTARVWMRKHPIYAFILSLPSFFSLSHASSSSPASRASQLREKKHHVSQQPGVQITRNTTLKRASRDVKKTLSHLKGTQTKPYRSKICSTIKTTVQKTRWCTELRTFLFIYTYVCVKRVKCAEKPQKGAAT